MGTLNVSGGTAPYVFSLATGQLPAGLILGAANGTISGTPTAAGSFSFSISVSDAKELSKQQSLQITVASAPVANPGNSFSNLQQSGGWGAYGLTDVYKRQELLLLHGFQFWDVGHVVCSADGSHPAQPNVHCLLYTSSFDHLDVNRYPYFGLPDWTHSNALVYTADGNLLLSMRNQSWILKIDYANGMGSGNLLWKLGQDGDFTLLGGDPSQWFYAQHYPNILSVNGSQTTLAVYDDGNLRIGSDGQPCGPPVPPAPDCYSRATIFQIDESTNIASLQWQYLPGFFSYWGGSIDVLSNGDVEFDSKMCIRDRL